MDYVLKIPRRLDNLNDLIRAERTNRYKGGALKEKNEKVVRAAIRSCLRGVQITKPVYMEYIWIEQNQRRDLDNISSFGRKVIQDALVKEGVLQNDNWKCIKGFSDRFLIDKWHPGVVVCIREISNE